MHSAQCMPIRAGVETIILPPQKIPRTFAADGQDQDTGFSIPENHALWAVSESPLTLTLTNPGDTDIVLPMPSGIRRVIPIRVIGGVLARSTDGSNYTLWIEDLRAMQPWICDGEFRP